MKHKFLNYYPTVGDCVFLLIWIKLNNWFPEFRLFGKSIKHYKEICQIFWEKKNPEIFFWEIYQIHIFCGYICTVLAEKIRPPTAKVCFHTPSVWYILCRLEGSFDPSETQYLIMLLSYSSISLWVTVSIYLTVLWPLQKSSRNDFSKMNGD